MQYEIDLNQSSSHEVILKSITIDTAEANLIKTGWLYERAHVQRKRRLLSALSHVSWGLNFTVGDFIDKNITGPLHAKANENLSSDIRTGFALAYSDEKSSNLIAQFLESQLSRNDEKPETVTLSGVGDIEVAMQGFAHYVRHVSADHIIDPLGNVDGPIALEMAQAVAPIAAVERERLRMIHEEHEPRLGYSAE